MEQVKAASCSPLAIGVLDERGADVVDAPALAVAASAAAFATAPFVYVVDAVATGAGVAAGPAAARRGVPLLLVRADELPAVTRVELLRLGARFVTVVGDVTTIVIDEMATLGIAVERAGGTDPVQTAAAVSATAFLPRVDRAYIMGPGGLADALVAGAAAAADPGPILATPANALAPATRAELERLAPRRIIVVAGADSVSDEVVTALDGLASDGAARLGAVDRYIAATAMAVTAFPHGTPVLVTARHQSGVVLIAPDSLPIPAAALAGRFALATIALLHDETGT